MGKGKEENSVQETAKRIWRPSSPAQWDISKQDVSLVTMLFFFFLPSLQTYCLLNLKLPLLQWLLTIVMKYNYAGAAIQLSSYHADVPIHIAPFHWK